MSYLLKNEIDCCYECSECGGRYNETELMRITDYAREFKQTVAGYCMDCGCKWRVQSEKGSVKSSIKPLETKVIYESKKCDITHFKTDGTCEVILNTNTDVITGYELPSSEEIVLKINEIIKVVNGERQ